MGKDESATINIDRQDSCKISVNAKGQFSGEVKVYGFTIEEAMAKAITKAEELQAKIKEKNPEVKEKNE